ncbi:MAG: patatin-like phospholipase family protein [Chloroflexota bacterium]
MKQQQSNSTPKDRPKIGLVLGGGGSRGLAHVGVLSVLQHANIPIDLIVGTSMGGLIAVFHAIGYTTLELSQGIKRVMHDEENQNTTWRRFMSTPADRQRQQRYHIEKELGDRTFADLQIPTTLMTVDMITGNEVQLNEGPLVPAILATTAVPGAFPPFPYKGMHLADGGVIDSLATHVAFAQGADKVIAVDIYTELKQEDPWSNPVTDVVGVQLPKRWFTTKQTDGDDVILTPTVVSSVWRSIRVITSHMHKIRLEQSPPDVYIRPEVEQYGSLDFTELQGPINAGIAAAKGHLPALKALLE